MSTSPVILDETLAVVLLSGGLDSMVAGGLAREAGDRLVALTIDYGQRHRIEIEAARRVAAALDVERHIELPIDLSAFGGSSLTQLDLAVRKDGVEEGIPNTYVPGRNIVFLALTLSLAEASGARRIYIGVNSLDYSGYPDCRPDFIAAFQHMAALGTKSGVEGRGVRICAPLQYMTKADIAKEAARLGLDAGMSWSCYDPTPEGLHCGHCDSCRLRSKGFEEAGLADPTRYAARS
ncbi:MAG: 7-cyano-7-deazaguanine synthase QueC [Sphingobium sp.]|nr:7-cyano-7-deazaguanine synthase QueC [Sphingobium sp.]